VLYRQYGRDGSKHGLDWQEVAVCIIQDGIQSCDQSVLASSTVQGFFSELLVQEEAVGLPVSIHLFEYTARWAPLNLGGGPGGALAWLL
jgi:chitin synthase